jgi:hypothetical protein
VQGRSISPSSSISATNASFGGHKDTIDVIEEPFKASCLGLIPDSDDDSEGETTLESSSDGNVAEVDHTPEVAATTFAPVPTLTSPSPSGLNAPSTIDPHLHSIVADLLIVPAAFFNPTTGTFSVPLSWAINIIGEDQFGHDALGPRKVLRIDSILGQRGLEAGMKVRMLTWLSNSLAGEVREFGGDVFDMVRE